jgi:protein-tyrosine phosphatase
MMACGRLTTEEAPEMTETRARPMTGLANLRDLGNLRGSGGSYLRTGVILRGPVPTAHWTATVGLGLRTVVDLRSAAERARTPPVKDVTGAQVVLTRPIGAPAAKFAPGCHPSPADYLENYRSLLPQAAPVVAELIGLLAGQQDGTPMLICCAAGKDRTGVLCALLLRALGVRLADVARDYALSARTLRRLSPGEAGEWSVGLASRDYALRAEAVPATVRSLLLEVERGYGRVEDYLARFSVTASDLARARALVYQPGDPG